MKPLPGELDIPNNMLIEEIRKRPELYDKTLPGYAKSDVKRNLWCEIAETLFAQDWKKWSKMQKSEAIVAIQKRWGNLRTYFAKEVKKNMKKKASGPNDDDKKYRYYDSMKFLRKFLAIKVIEGEEDTQDDSIHAIEDNESDEHNNTYESNGSDPRNSTFEDNGSDRRRSNSNTFETNGSNRRNSEANESENQEDWQEEYVEQYLDSIGSIEHRDDAKRIKIEQVENVYRSKVDDIKIIKVEQVNDANSKDQDTNFALSLVPMLMGLPLNKKIKAQIEILKVFQRITNNDN